MSDDTQIPAGNNSDPEIMFTVVDPESEPAIEAMTNYFNELNATFRTGFDVAAALASGLDAMRPPTGTFLVALAGNGQVLGCGGVQALDDAAAEIRRMWIAPPARGIGLGREMLRQLEEAARAMGFSQAVLDSNSVLTPAISLYERAGYVPTEPFNDNPYADVWYIRQLT